MNHKTFEPQHAGHVKLDTAGEGTALIAFAQLNVIDKDGDVTVPGAFKSGQAIKVMQYGHRWSSLPVGRGTIYEDGDWAFADIKFFLGTDHGRNTYETVKEMGDLQEWSYGFNVVEADRAEIVGRTVQVLKALDVFEVSPVMIGAGVGTHTVALKGSGDDNGSTDTANPLDAVIAYELAKARRLGVNV